MGAHSRTRVHEPRRRHRRADVDVRLRLRPEDGRGHRRASRAAPGHPARTQDVRDVRAGVVDADRRGRPGCPFFNDTTKYVVSGTLTEGDWRNSEILGAVRRGRDPRLKDEVAGDIYVSGSGTLVRALLADGLVDELHLFVYPLTLGPGPRLFDEKRARTSCPSRDRTRIRTASSTSRTVRSDGVRRTTAGPRRRRGDDRRDLAPAAGGTGTSGTSPRSSSTFEPRSRSQRVAERIPDTTVATVDGAVVGFVMVVDDEVEQVYVSSGARGTGVADELMREAERQVRTNGHTRRGSRSSPATRGPAPSTSDAGWVDEGTFDYAAAAG